MENISKTILNDLRVLEVGEGTAVGWCGRMLLDFGAQVFRLKNKSIKKLEDKDNMIEEFKKSKLAQDIQKAFPDAKLVDLKEEE